MVRKCYRVKNICLREFARISTYTHTINSPGSRLLYCVFWLCSIEWISTSYIIVECMVRIPVKINRVLSTVSNFNKCSVIALANYIDQCRFGIWQGTKIMEARFSNVTIRRRRCSLAKPSKKFISERNLSAF